jgi:energy-converting hydrogenase Eha subunit H
MKILTVTAVLFAAVLIAVAATGRRPGIAPRIAAGLLRTLFSLLAFVVVISAALTMARAPARRHEACPARRYST